MFTQIYWYLQIIVLKIDIEIAQFYGFTIIYNF